jgi:hypothetical protein
MKKLLSIAVLIGLTVAANAAVFSTNIVATASTNILLTTSRASVYSVELTSPASTMIELFDCDSVAAPYNGTNSTNASYVSRTTYATNIATSYVGANGYTNWYTNSGLWTVTTTNAASTNALTPQLTFVAQANTVGSYSTDALFTRGICVRCTTNVTLVINYKSAQ